MAKKQEKEIIRCNATDLPENIIGAAVLVENNKIPHAGLFIRYNGDSKLFHFDGVKVLLENVKDEEIYFFKELPYLKPGLTPSFLTHCQVVMKEAKPVMGYFYIGALYDAQGKFRSAGDMPEYMTCVGFCLNFLKYFTDGVDLFEIGGWKSMNVKRKEGYIADFIESVRKQHPTINIADFKEGIRRIFPNEYFTGAFSEALPVNRAFIDENLPKVQEELLKLAVA